MKHIKSIDDLFSLFLGSLIFIDVSVLIFFLFIPHMVLKYFLALTVVVYMQVTLFVLFYKKIKFISFLLILIVTLYLILFITFRKIRDYFPNPQAEGSDIVGFAKYFDYPIYFDYFLFLIIIAIPFFTYFLVKRFLRK